MRKETGKTTRTTRTTVQRYTVKINGRTSSVTLKNYLVALYLAKFGNDSDSHFFIYDKVTDLAMDWEKDSGKGLSDFVSQRMIESVVAVTMKKECGLKSYRAEIAKLAKNA